MGKRKHNKEKIKRQNQAAKKLSKRSNMMGMHDGLMDDGDYGIGRETYTTRGSVSTYKHINKAAPFLPHTFQNKITFTGKAIPKILISKPAFDKMWNIVDIGDKEVGWLGSASVMENGDFLIEEIFIPKQEVHSATCELSPEGIAELVQELMEARGDDAGVEIANKLNFWGHSHHTMGTGPSAQDDTQLRAFVENGKDWFIRGILNKLGRMEFTIFIYSLGIVINDPAWEVFQPVDTTGRAEVEAEFRDKVKNMGWNFNKARVGYEWEKDKKKPAKTNPQLSDSDASSEAEWVKSQLSKHGDKVIKYYNPVQKFWEPIGDTLSLDGFDRVNKKIEEFESVYKLISIEKLQIPEECEVVFDNLTMIYSLVEKGVTA